MKILVLGNGFDVDHHLPTSYADFLNFSRLVLQHNLNGNDIGTGKQIKNAQEKHLKKMLANRDLHNEFNHLLRDNLLFRYFWNRIKSDGENWIDLEREIRIVVSELKELEAAFRSSGRSVYKIERKHKIVQLMRDLGLPSKTLVWDESSLNRIHDTLCKDLENFSKALELYIVNVINNTPVEGVSPDVIDFDADKVISFNYSNTYERVYNELRRNADIEYIHGQAIGETSNYSSIVLGITSGSDVGQSNYVEFEKYYQRITKKTGNNYKKWLQSINSGDRKIEVLFFGHSLDSSDSDVITDLICNKQTSIRIVYHSQKAYRQIVSNLIEIIGKNQLISYVSGTTPKIAFSQQQPHDDGTTAGLEVLRDIRSLFHLYSSSQHEANALLNKIDQKIEMEDISYFYSQRKVISLFDALGNHIDPSKYKEKLLKISSKLAIERRNGRAVKFLPSEWYDYAPWGTEIPCSDKTKIIISAVNEMNMAYIEKERAEEQYAYLLKIETSEHMKNALLEIFQADNSTDKFWKQMEEIIKQLTENAILEGALELLEKEKLPMLANAKYCHFKDIYYEFCYDKYIEAQIEKEEKCRHSGFTESG